MRLNQLLEDLAAYSKMVDGVRASNHRSLLGKGRENAAYSKATQPHRAYRIGQSTQAGSVYLTTIATERPTNPMLPHVKSTRNVAGGIQVAAAERLQPLSVLATTEEFRDIARQVVGDQADIITFDTKVDTPIALRSACDWLAEMVFWYLAHGEYPFTKYRTVTPELSNAREFIQRVVQKANDAGIPARVDNASEGNLMLRRVGGHYQLVINDPITSQR